MWIGEDHNKGKQNFNDFHMLTFETSTTKPTPQTLTKSKKISVYFSALQWLNALLVKNEYT